MTEHSDSARPRRRDPEKMTEGGQIMDYYERHYISNAQEILCELDRTLTGIDSHSVELLAEAILSADQVFFVGVGRVMLALQCICKRLAHLGIRTHYVGEITEPHLNPQDLLIVGSGSGSSLFPLGIAKKARQEVGCTIVHIGSNPNSEMREIADFMVRIPVRTKLYLEDEIDSAQPMTSLFEQSLLLLGDILAKMIVEEKGLELRSLWQYHANME